MSAELKPCPFCGSKNIDAEGWASIDRKGPACDDCSATAETVEIWNCRSLSTPNPGDAAHPDDLAVDRFAEAMKAKLAKKRDEGRCGWDDMHELDMNERLSRFLRQHVEKGDPLDVGNFAMMLHQRGERIESLTAHSNPGDADGWRAIVDRIVPPIEAVPEVDQDQYCCETAIWRDRERIRKELLALSAGGQS